MTGCKMLILCAERWQLRSVCSQKIQESMEMRSNICIILMVSRVLLTVCIVTVTVLSGNVGVGIAEVEALLCQVKSLIVWTCEVQTIDIAEVQSSTWTRIRRRQTNLICSKSDVQSLKSTQGTV